MSRKRNSSFKPWRREWWVLEAWHFGQVMSPHYETTLAIRQLLCAIREIRAPDLKSHPGLVTDCLLTANAGLVKEEIAPETEDDDF